MAEFMSQRAVDGRQSVLDQELVMIGELAPLARHTPDGNSPMLTSMGRRLYSPTAATRRASDTSPVGSQRQDVVDGPRHLAASGHCRNRPAPAARSR